MGLAFRQSVFKCLLALTVRLSLCLFAPLHLLERVADFLL